MVSQRKFYLARNQKETEIQKLYEFLMSGKKEIYREMKTNGGQEHPTESDTEKPSRTGRDPQ